MSAPLPETRDLSTRDGLHRGQSVAPTAADGVVLNLRRAAWDRGASDGLLHVLAWCLMVLGGEV